MAGVSFEQLMKPLQIYKLVRLLHEQGMFFQNLLRMGPGSAPAIVSPNRTFGYDTYASTRTMAPITSPQAPPSAMGAKPIGQNTATMVRTHGFVPILEEKVYMSRPPGGRLAEVDASGRRYIALQLDHMIQSFRNNREFMISRMLRGGFGLEQTDGDQYRLRERGDANANISVDYNIPGENFADLGGIIAAGQGWNSAGAPLLTQFLTLSKRMAQKSGYTPKHVILNSTTAAPLFSNTQLRTVRGDAMTVFNSFTQKPMDPKDAQTSSVYTVVFGALPFIQFHILNEGSVLDDVVPNEANQISDSLFKLFVPDGKAIIIPEPDARWTGWAAGIEPVRERVDQLQSRYVQGFGVWRTPQIDPPRYDVKAVDNGVPLLFLPRVVHFADVWEPYTSSES